MKKDILGHYTIEEVAAEFGLPSWEKISELNTEYFWENSRYAYETAIEKGLSEEEAEEARSIAAGDEEHEYFCQWYDAVERAANTLYEHHNLTLVGVGKETRPYHLILTRLDKKLTWKQTAAQVIETINGYGMFEFKNPQELKQSGPYKSYKEATLEHAGWCKDYAAVYGDYDAKYIYERAMR